jgi:hypothetical protein
LHSFAIVVGGYSMYADAHCVEKAPVTTTAKNLRQRIATVNSLRTR